MINPRVALALMLIGLVMSFPEAIYESHNPRRKGEPLEPRRIALMTLSFMGTLLLLFSGAATLSYPWPEE